MALLVASSNCFKIVFRRAGNATFADVVVIWARNLETKQVNAFIVKKGTPGFTTTKIEAKISLRQDVIPSAPVPPDAPVLIPWVMLVSVATCHVDTRML